MVKAVSLDIMSNALGEILEKGIRFRINVISQGGNHLVASRRLPFHHMKETVNGCTTAYSARSVEGFNQQRTRNVTFEVTSNNGACLKDGSCEIIFCIPQESAHRFNGFFLFFRRRSVSGQILEHVENAPLGNPSVRVAAIT